MDADNSFKPVFLSAIGRSGTFIIEPARENVKDNNPSESPPNKQQKATPPDDTKLKIIAQAPLEKDKTESSDITSETRSNTAAPNNGNLSPKAEARKGKTGSPDVSTESTGTEQVYLHEANGTKNDDTTELGDKRVELHDTRHYESELQDVSIKNSKVESPDVFSESKQTPEIEPRKNKSPDVSGKRCKTKTPHTSFEHTTRNSLDDVTTKNGEIVSPDVHSNAQAISPDVPFEKFQTQLPDYSTSKNKTESQVETPAQSTNSKPSDVGRITDESEPPDVTTNNNTAQDLITITDGKTASPHVHTIKSQVDSPDVTLKNKDDVENNESEPGKSRGSCSRASSQSSERGKAEGHEIIERASLPSTSDGPTRTVQPKPRDDQGASRTYISTSSTSPGSSNFPNENLRPTPAPRRSVVKQTDESTDKYVLLHTELCERWKSVAQVSKFQTIDKKTKAILQEQADRRLMTLCPPSYVEDSRLMEKVGEALKQFYDQEITDKNHGNDKPKKLQGLPTLQFLQWILPALDGKTQDLLFGCDIMKPSAP